MSAPAAERYPGPGSPLPDWRLPAIETWPAVLAFARTLAGKLVLFALFALLAKLVGGGTWPHGIWLQLTASAALVSLAGPQRRLAALVCTAALLMRLPFDLPHAAIWRGAESALLDEGLLHAASLAFWLPVSATMLVLAHRFRDHPLGGRPLVLQHLLAIALLVLLGSRIPGGFALTALSALTATLFAWFWFLAYALMDARSRTPLPAAGQLAGFFPFFGLTHMPYGKGRENWQRMEAASAEELAVTQLKGLKLMAWALILKVVLQVFRHVLYTRLGITPVFIAFDHFVVTGSADTRFGLLGILVNFPEQVLILAIKGHALVAVARLAGFRLLRNTCRPLSSRTVAEFWNRYFYYFKEILANIYFYPTYVRCFKHHPRLRMAFATFMAAGVGNFFFHFILRDRTELEHFDLLAALRGFQTYAFYCAVLVTGIVVSQLRSGQRRRTASAGWWRGRCLPSLGVALFYCFLSFFDGPQRHVALALHFEFLLHCFGVD